MLADYFFFVVGVGHLHDDIPRLARDNILMLNWRFELSRIVQLEPEAKLTIILS